MKLYMDRLNNTNFVWPIHIPLFFIDMQSWNFLLKWTSSNLCIGGLVYHFNIHLTVGQTLNFCFNCYGLSQMLLRR